MVKRSSMTAFGSSQHAPPEKVLATVNLKDLHHVRSDGSRLWDQLIKACQVPNREGVFSYAARHHPSWCLDYVAEVCGDRNLTSNDLEEAQLLDGTFVKAWCSSSLQTMQQQLLAMLRSDTSLQQLSSTQVEQELMVAGVIVNVLKALEHIRGSAAGQLVTDGSATATLSSESAASSTGAMAHAVQIQRALGLLLWCLENHMHKAAATGVHASHPDWTRHVQARRDRRVTDAQLFLDDLLQALALSGYYPFKSPCNAIHMLISTAISSVTGNRPPPATTTSALTGTGAGLAISSLLASGAAAWWDAEPQHDRQQAAPDNVWHACCALLLYYLTDLGVLQPGTAAGEQLLSSFSAAFQAPLQRVSMCCAAALLDDAAVSSSPTLPAAAAATPSKAVAAAASTAATRDRGPLLHACELLQKYPPTSVHIKLLKVLCGAGCADVALALHRAQAHATGSLPANDPATCAEDAWALVQIRLRCGLLAEALSLTRALVAASHPADSSSSCSSGQLRASPLLSRLLRGILDWSTETGSKGGASQGWSHTLMLELCCSPQEQQVLVDWLLEALQAGKPVSHLLPVIMATRGRIPEALGAYQHWRSVWDSQPQLGFRPAVDAVVNAAAQGLPAPLRNLNVLGLSSGTRPAGPAALLAGLNLSCDTGVPVMVSELHMQGDGSWLPATLTQTAIPPCPPFTPSGEQEGVAHQKQTGAAQRTAEQPPFSTDYPQSTPAAAGGSTAFVGRLLARPLPYAPPGTEGRETGGLLFAAPSAAAAAAVMPSSAQAPPLGSLFGAAANPAPRAGTGVNMSVSDGGARSLFALSPFQAGNLSLSDGGMADGMGPVAKRPRSNAGVWAQV